MYENFELLFDRVMDTLDVTNLDYINHELSSIHEPIICSGVGGSNVVSEFASKVLERKNNIISINAEPRDFIYRDINNFKNVLSCSYGGKNYGVDLSFNNDLKKYLLSSSFKEREDVTNLTYSTTIKPEHSFISLASTLMPISILLNYYTENCKNVILSLLNECECETSFKGNIFEIFTGFDTTTSSKYLDSTLVEAGIGIPIIHDKYEYCHGRSTIMKDNDTNIIYFNRGTEFDLFMLNELKSYKDHIIRIDSKYDDIILDDYQMLIKSMYLTKSIAKREGKDLSKVDYLPIVKKVYKYNGGI